ncbi:hypothetical protein [Bradyrhizobium algeriense]|uniref:hypothetical protein n=1 Tax=Bradyrhizobium algeriense TaxID=634784 RepID=UPI000D3422D4|nr:hypothetical protein [Bradyrhizobium algeriense]
MKGFNAIGSLVIDKITCYLWFSAGLVPAFILGFPVDAEKVQNIVTYSAGAVAVFSIIGALYQAMSREGGSVAPVLGVFLAACVIVFLPLISQFSFFGLETRMRDKVLEVQAIEDRIRKIAAINARVTYMSIAWANRMGSPSAKEKQTLLDDVDKQIREFKVTEEERLRIVQPVVNMLKYDFFLDYRQIIYDYAGIRYGILVENARNEAPETRELRDAHSDGMGKYNKRVDISEVWRRLDSFNFGEELNTLTPTEWLNDDEKVVANEFRNKLVRIVAECEKKGGYTSEAAQLQDAITGDSKEFTASLFRVQIDKLKSLANPK